MTESEQSSLHRWFDGYVKRFCRRDGNLPSMLELKRSHSLRVAGNARYIAAALCLPAAAKRLAEGAGLVHDVGRFTQFARYGSFRDADTFDHGAEGCRVLEKENLSAFLNVRDCEILLFAIECHNRKQVDIPRGQHPEQDLLLNLIRDADKLDVMDLVLRSVAQDGFQELPDMLPHIRLSLEVSPGVVSEAVRTKSLSFSRLSTLADFLVMIATWFHDLNYAPTRRLALERDLLTRLRRELPDTEGMEDLFAGIGEAMSKKNGTS